MAFRTGLQLARVPVLLALLAAAVPVMGRLIEARARLAAEEAEQVGALLTALAIAFVVVALAGSSSPPSKPSI